MSTTTPGQSGPRSNGKKGVDPHYPRFHERSITTRGNLELYLEYPFWGKP